MGSTSMSGTNRQNVSLGWVRHDEALTKMAAACWAKDRFTDVTIFCEDRVLHAHKLVLASMSPLLANLLSEAEGPDTALLLPEVKAEDMKLLLQFIYQGEVVLPPRRTAALLDLAAQLFVAGVRGGTSATPPSPPRSDSPELDSSDRNESDHVSEDEQQMPSTKEMEKKNEKDSLNSNSALIVLNDKSNDGFGTDLNHSEDESNDSPMNLAARPELKTNGTVNCPRPKPCSSSPPDFSIFSKHTPTRTSIVTRLSDNRSSALSYYQHPVLRGCHPFSLELALNHHQGSRTPEANHYKKQYPKEKLVVDNANSDVEISLDNDDDADREIDLSLKPDSNRSRPNSSDEDKMISSPDQDNSIGSNEATDKFKGREGLLSSSTADVRLSLADKMLLLPSGGSGIDVDPRRTYLEAVLQESLVQQSYTIVLPSHLGSNLPFNSDNIGSTSSPAIHSPVSLENKPWNLTGKNSAAAAVAELQCLQGFFSSRGTFVGSGGSESNYGRSSNVHHCDDDEDDEMEEDDDSETLPTNLSTSKNGNCGSSSSSLNSKRNTKEGYSCQVCRKMFTSSSNLAVHSMIHSGTKPFKCDLCSWSFRQKAHLQKHMRHIHKIIVAK